MSAPRHLGVFPAIGTGRTLAASGSNVSANLLQGVTVGTDGTGLGEISPHADACIPGRPTDGTPRTLLITVDNRAGTADAYWARPEDIPTAGSETAPYGALVIPSGEIVQYGFDAATFDRILRLIDGAAVAVTVEYQGLRWWS